MRALRRPFRFALTTRLLALAVAVTLAPIWTACGGEERGETRSLELQESTELSIAAHPTEPRVVFTLLGSLWSVSDTGGAAERLTGVEQVARYPAWDPEGRRLAFVAVRGSRHALAILEEGRQEPRLFRERMEPLAGPAWSPDGERLAYLRGSGEGCEVRSVPAADPGAGEARLWASGASCGSALAWTDRGIVFARGAGSDGGESGSDLWRIGAPGAEAEPVAGGPGEQWAPVATGGEGGLYLERAGATTALRSFPGGEPVAEELTGEVGRAAVRAGPDGAVFVPADGRLWRVDADGEQRAVPFRASITVRRPSYDRRAPDLRLSGGDTARGIFAPRLSPDGRRVAFSAMGDIWVMALDSASRPRAVITGPAEETMPAWSPDGSRLAYVSNQGGDRDLWTAALDGSDRSRITRLVGDEMEPAWGPRGERLAFSFFDNWTVDLFWVPVSGGEPRRLTRHRAWNWDLSPAWGPDGERIAFLERTEDRSTPHVALIRPGAEVGASEPLDLEELPITALAWSPNGELVYRSGGVLRAARLAGDSAVRGDASLGDARAFHPSFDGRGDQLLYLSTDGLRLRSWPDGGESTIPVALEVPERPMPPPVTIRNVRLIDGTGAPPRGPVDIRIEEGRIVEIVPAGDSAAARSAGEETRVRVLDGSGLTAFPGLIEAHTHLFHYGMRAYLGTGVTTVRDVGFESHLIASRWEGVQSGRLPGPRIAFAGEFLDGPGGPWMGNFVVTVTSPEQVRAEVARLADFGASWLKTYVRMPPDLRLAAIEAAHEHGLPTTQHEIYPAVAYGADGKEHVRPGWRNDIRKILASSGALVVPTLDVVSGAFVYMRDHPEIWSREDVQGLLPEYVRTSFRQDVEEADSARAAAARSRYEDAVETTRWLREHEAHLAVGTDPSNPHVLYGIGVHWELEHLVDAGFSPLEALHIATGGAARELGVGEQLGTVAEGKLADIVLVEGDPASDIRDTRRIRWVVFGGNPIQPSEMYLSRLSDGRSRGE